MKRSVPQLVLAQLAKTQIAIAATLLIAAGSAPCLGVTLATVHGVVRDASGTPQIGVVVQLLRPDTTIAAKVYTDSKGFFQISHVLPGRYTVKAMGASFLPTLRENLKIRANLVVNLTLNTLYDVMQWMPAKARSASANRDDWEWTLRSSVNRPLLRWLEDGPLVVVSDDSGAAPVLKARVKTIVGDAGFAEGGERVSVAINDRRVLGRQALAMAEFSPAAPGNFQAVAGLRQQMGLLANAQTVAAVSLHPEIQSGTGRGMQSAMIRTWETMQLLDNLEAQAGSEQVVVRAAGDTLAAALPFASLALLEGRQELRYGVSTAPSLDGSAEAEGGDLVANGYLPTVAERQGRLAMQHGLHQEVGWSEEYGGPTGARMQVLFYQDRIDNPALHATGTLSAADQAGGWMLLDRASGQMLAAAQGYAAAGMLASVEGQLPGGNRIVVRYANGDAMVMTPMPSASGAANAQASFSQAGSPPSLAQLIAGAKARRAQMASLSVTGTVDRTGTYWRANYRWQSQGTLTAVAPFAQESSPPFLNLYVRQPIHCWHPRRSPESETSAMRSGDGGVEALIDVRNLLAEGYMPYVTSDGSRLFFAQADRSIRGGFAFTF